MLPATIASDQLSIRRYQTWAYDRYRFPDGSQLWLCAECGPFHVKVSHAVKEEQR